MTAAWSSVYGLVFLFRSAGFAFNEVVVTLIGQPEGVRKLHRITWGMALTTSGLLGIVAFTPIGSLFFRNVIGLAPHLATVAIHALGFAVLMPGYAVLQSYYQGALVHARRTRAITEAVVLYLVVSSVVLAIGISVGSIRGIEFALCAFTFAGLLQTTWLWYRSRTTIARLNSH